MTAFMPEPRGHGHSLAVITARGRCDARQAGLGLFEPIDVDQRPAQLEGSGRRMIFVLDPGIGSQPLIEQWPCVLRCRRHEAVDQGLRIANLG